MICAIFYKLKNNFTPYLYIEIKIICFVVSVCFKKCELCTPKIVLV